MQTLPRCDGNNAEGFGAWKIINECFKNLKLASLVLKSRICRFISVSHKKEAIMVNSWLSAQPRVMKTIDGKTVHFIDWGQINNDEGPDVLNTQIILGEKWLKGDIEFHRDQRDWERHRHDRNPKYNQVILHIVEKDRNQSNFTANGKNLPVAEYNQNQTDYRDIPQNLPFQPIYDVSVFEGFGIRRFSEKVSKLSTIHQTGELWNQLLIKGVARALGYSKNSEAMERLADFSKPYWCMLSKDQFIHQILSIAGLAEKAYSQAIALPLMSRQSWKYFRLRPANFPHRRIVQWAGWLYDQNFEPFQRLSFALNGSRPEEWTNQLFADFLQVPSIGNHRKSEIIGNVILPVLAAFFLQNLDWKRYEQIFRLWKNLPAGNSSNIYKNFCDTAIFYLGDSRLRFIHQQGILQMKQLYCNLGGCSICPLMKNAETYRSNCL